MPKNLDGRPYEIGYGKPPVHTRFPERTSGNPQGRPKGSTNHLTALRRVLDQKVSVVEDGKRRKISKLEAAMTQLLNKAAQGDTRACQAILKVVTLLGLKPEERERGLTFIIEG